ncbi:MAG: hypothetical protein B7Z26_05005 [Asticcacaulis sp. 32-58-5]|nr:MAG: hypothetical protein B7Z26_05005 [Asticcacaulis sp. 32-58-5]
MVKKNPATLGARSLYGLRDIFVLWSHDLSSLTDNGEFRETLIGLWFYYACLLQKCQTEIVRRVVFSLDSVKFQIA